MKVSLLPNFSRVDEIPIKILGGSFVEIDKLILKFTWNSQTTLRKLEESCLTSSLL